MRCTDGGHCLLLDLVSTLLKGDGTAEQCKGGQERGFGVLGGHVLTEAVRGAFPKVAGEPSKYCH